MSSIVQYSDKLPCFNIKYELLILLVECVDCIVFIKHYGTQGTKQGIKHGKYKKNCQVHRQ